MGKRSAKTAPSSTAPTSPFKRLKAKVGKKAPQAANYTNTEFRAASLHVPNQDANTTPQEQSTTAASSLVSGRGRSVAELQSQMHHPAAAVRISAMKGIQDILHLSTKNNNNKSVHDDMISANLSGLLSAIGKAAVDEEEEEVRKMGLEAFTSLLATLNNNAGGAALMLMKPFLPIVMAFFKSALNSLDRDTRRDGLAFVHALAQQQQQGAGDGGALSLQQHVTPMIPALIRLWDDAAFQANATASSAASSSNKKKNKKKNKKQKKQQQQQQNQRQGTTTTVQFQNGRYPLLDCLAELLSAAVSETAGDGRTNNTATLTTPSFLYAQGGRSKNALLVLSSPRQQRGPNLLPLDTLQDFASASSSLFSSSGGGWKHNSHSSNNSCSISLEAATNLLSKLCDTVIELQQNTCLVTLHRLVVVLDLFWLAHGKELVQLALEEQQQQPGTPSSSKKSRKLDFGAVCGQLSSLLLEAFPVTNNGSMLLPSAAGDTPMVDACNGQLCLTMVRMIQLTEGLTRNNNNSGNSSGQDEHNKQRSSNWLKPVADYICNKLQDKSLKRPGNEVSLETILQVLHKLLRRDHHHQQGVFVTQRIPRLEQKLVQAFLTSIVPDKFDNKDNDSNDGDDDDQNEDGTNKHANFPRHVARSTAGSIIVQLATTIFANADHDLERAHQMYGNRMLQFLVVLPDVLVACAGDYLDSSATIVQLLSRLFRARSSSAAEATQEVPQKNRGGGGAAVIDSTAARIQTRLEQVLDPSTTATTETTSGGRLSILEMYPPHLQRSIIALYATMGTPTPQSLAHMSDLCARSNLSLSPQTQVSSDVAAFLVRTIFSIRKTIPMQQFLSFLVDCTGATRSPNNEEEVVMTEKLVVRFDQGTRETGQCLIACGVEKIVPLVSPLLVVLMKEDPSQTASPACQFYRTRFAFSLLAMFALSMKQWEKGHSLLPLLPNSSLDLITDSIVDNFAKTGGGNDISTLMVAPILALVFAEPELLSKIVHSTLNKLPNQVDETSQLNALHWLRNMTAQDQRFGGSLPNEATLELLEHAKAIGAKLSGRAEQLAAEIVVSLEVVSHPSAST